MDGTGYPLWRLFGYDERALKWNPDEHRPGPPARRPPAQGKPHVTTRRGTVELAKKIKGV